MLRMTMSLTLLVMGTLAVTRLSCLAENEGSSRVEKAATVAEFGQAAEEPALVEIASEPDVLVERAPVAIESDRAFVEHFNEFQQLKTDSGFPFSTPVVSTSSGTDLPVFEPFDSQPSAIPVPETTEEAIAWQGGEALFAEPRSDQFSASPKVSPLEFNNQPAPFLDGTKSAEDAASAPELQEDQWQPALNVIINQPAGSAASSFATMQTVRQRENVPVTTETATGKVTTFQTITKEVQVINVAGGITFIRCDEIDSRTSRNDEGQTRYEFEINSKLELRNASVTIEAESASFKEGEITLKGVTLKSPYTTVHSDEIKMELDVTSLRVGEPIQLNRTPPEPTPAMNSFRPVSY